MSWNAVAIFSFIVFMVYLKGHDNGYRRAVKDIKERNARGGL